MEEGRRVAMEEVMKKERRGRRGEKEKNERFNGASDGHTAS